MPVGSAVLRAHVLSLADWCLQPPNTVPDSRLQDPAAKYGGGGKAEKSSWRKSISKRLSLSKKPPSVVIRKASLRASGAGPYD